MKQIKDITNEKVFKFFSHHIGEENVATLSEVSLNLFEHKLNTSNEYESEGMISLATRLVEKYRTSRILFIMKKNSKFYIPNSKEDLEYFKEVCRRIIVGMKNSMIYLDTFIENKEYKKVLLQNNLISN